MSKPRSSVAARVRPFLATEERELAEAISRLAYCNPFTRERLELERRVLGETFTPFDVVWHAQIDPAGDNPNLPGITERARALAERLRARLHAARSVAATGAELDLYRDLVLYLVYNLYQARFLDAIELQEAAQETAQGAAPGRKREPEGRVSFAFYRQFLEDLRYFLEPSRARPGEGDPAHLFACFFQIRRAFHFTLRSIVGGSPPAARLREQIWQSVFTHDLRRYQRALYLRMGDVTTLVTGASGTGKELVARAIGHSRYLPFDGAALTFRESWATSFFPLNLSALSPTLIESELFGHCRGAYTGAVADRAGWFELCPHLGTVFLDEIGETDPAIQVKLLRVLETRVFQRLGETRERTFQGKVVAATNRDLAHEMHTGRFRADLYYRLCSDLLTTPTLAERIAAAPEELSNLVLYLSRRAAGDELAEELARDVTGWIAAHLGTGYAWPGNVRELAQCVNNVLIRRDYRPARAGGGGRGPRERLAAEIVAGRLEAEEMLWRYCTLVYAEAGSYEEAGRRLGLDRRTVKSRVDAALL
nr:sigma-54 factor interaction domain-containing protein [Acidobacteriota bacterium]